MYIYQMLGGEITLFAGILFFIFAINLKNASLFIPAGVLSAAGGIQIYAGSSANYVTWIYLWPIIFAGLGMGFILFGENNKYSTLTWLGKIWCGLGFVFTALGYALYQFDLTIFNWPMVIIGVGLLFLLPGISGKLRAFRIPGFFLTGLGTLLMLQWITHNWQSWSYAWAVLPALVGLGIITASHENNKAFTAGNIILGISFLFFLVFAAVFSGYWHIIRFWPLILIILGFWQLLRLNHHKSMPIHNWDAQKKEALE